MIFPFRGEESPNEMQRTELPPPTHLPERAGAVTRPPRAGRAVAAPRGRLDAPHEAVERPRPLFHPDHGWFRRAERAASHFLARAVYPRIPGIGVPYSAQLRRDLVLSEATIRLAGLPSALRGLRMLLITDVHAGPFVAPEVLRQTFARLQAVEPDLILVGGDLVSARTREVADNAAAFRSLRAPLGVFGVLGNHDHYAGRPDEVSASAADCGIEMLHNRSVPIERRGERIWLAGVDDALLGHDDLERALHGTAPPLILLSHNPDLLFDAARHGVSLMLSGHTHAGQIRVPGLGVLVRQSRFRLDEGRYRYRATDLVVSRGLGASGVPLRLACSPEAVSITLD